MSPERNLSALVTGVFQSWRSGGVDFLILRNYENLPAETGNDIDVLVRPEHLRKAEMLLIRAAEEVGYRIHNRAEFSPISIFVHHPTTLQQLQFDLFAQLKWRGFVLLPHEAALRARLDRGLFDVPHPAHEAVSSLLTRLIYHGYVKENYKPAIATGVREHRNEVQSQLAQLFGPKLAGAVTEAILRADWTAVEARTGALRRQLIWRQLTHRPFSTLRSLGTDLARLARRFFQPPGLSVVLTGADGCGKSTVATRLVEALRGTYHENKSLRVHWKPAVFLRKRRGERPPTTDPHGQPPRGVGVSAALLCYHWSEFFVGYWLQMRRVLFRNGLVLIDRYHYDFLVDPQRFRLAALPRWARFLFRLLPPPDLVFLLDAPPELLQSRKREVPLAETIRQREAYRWEIGRLPQGRIIDASQSADEVTANVLRNLLAHMANRQASRAIRVKS